ncbi:NAD(P)H-flavin reductase [Legionella sp. CNM-4043-24]|uniref:NAD(P)H-flavin reductase n=1 Tax=Legionella sp. CNM-4043-24 TaxID=3421646 RepID=UPI00403AA0AA
MNSVEMDAQVTRINPVTDKILVLHLLPERYMDYQAGQYLQLMSAGEWLSYSIANAPLGAHNYELHIRHDPQNTCNQALFTEIRQTGTVRIRLPFGECHLDRLDSDLPILFIAGGTGFAPINAMIEQLLASGDQRPFALYWGARSQSDLYLDEKVRQWQAHVSHFRYQSLLSAPGSTETLAGLVLQNHARDLSDYQIVISGPFDMVYATRDALVAAGVAESRLYSDAFAFEKTGSK